MTPLETMRFELVNEFLDAAETLAWRCSGDPVAFEAQMLELVRSTARFWTEREQMLAKVEPMGSA